MCSFCFFHIWNFNSVCKGFATLVAPNFPLSFAGDKTPDILICQTPTVRFLSHSVVLAGVTNISEHPAILQTTANVSLSKYDDMQAVDFDEDGDLDLVVIQGFDRIPRYFERVLDELKERTGEQNPFQAFPAQVERIADLDGDGRLDVLVADRHVVKTCRWRYFRRTAAGTFVEPWENPLAEMQFRYNTKNPFFSYGAFEPIVEPILMGFQTSCS